MKKTMIFALIGLLLLSACSSARYTNGKGKMKKGNSSGYCYYPVFNN